MNISEKLIMVYIKFYLIQTRVETDVTFVLYILGGVNVFQEFTHQPYCAIHRIQARVVVILFSLQNNWTLFVFEYKTNNLLDVDKQD